MKLIFLDGLILFPSKREYLTKKVNVLFEISRDLSRVAEGNKKTESSNFLDLSASVPIDPNLSNKYNEYFLNECIRSEIIIDTIIYNLKP